MVTDIDKLLALPPKERRKIAEKLWHSLSPQSVNITEDKKLQSLLEKRWSNIHSGKANLLSPEDFWKKMDKHFSAMQK